MAMKRRKLRPIADPQAAGVLPLGFTRVNPKKKRKRDKKMIAQPESSPGEYKPGFVDFFIGVHRVRVPTV